MDCVEFCRYIDANPSRAELPEGVREHWETCEGCRRYLSEAEMLKDARRMVEGDLVEGAEEAPMIRIAYSIIQQAIRDGASAILITPQELGFRVQYRIDGEDREVISLPYYVEGPLVARFKAMADVDVDRRDREQEGMIPIRWDGTSYRLLVTITPEGCRERVLARIEYS